MYILSPLDYYTYTCTVYDKIRISIALSLEHCLFMLFVHNDCNQIIRYLMMNHAVIADGESDIDKNY